MSLRGVSLRTTKQSRGIKIFAFWINFLVIEIYYSVPISIGTRNDNIFSFII